MKILLSQKQCGIDTTLSISHDECRRPRRGAHAADRLIKKLALLKPSIYEGVKVLCRSYEGDPLSTPEGGGSPRGAVPLTPDDMNAS